MAVSRPGPARVIPSVGDLNPLGVVENEARRISSLQDQLSQANVNVDCLRRDMQFVDRQILAAQRHSRDCAPLAFETEMLMFDVF